VAQQTPVSRCLPHAWLKIMLDGTRMELAVALVPRHRSFKLTLDHCQPFQNGRDIMLCPHIAELGRHAEMDMNRLIPSKLVSVSDICR
jgi:hypothetical protein